MGYSVPAAVGAKIAFPDRMVVSMVGDGGFMMTGQEIATAFHHGVAPIVLVFNNQMYGTIRMHQERAYPWRVSGTALTNPDFSKYIEAFGGHGEVVAATEEFSPAFRRAVESGKPALIELRTESGADHDACDDHRSAGGPKATAGVGQAKADRAPAHRVDAPAKKRRCLELSACRIMQSESWRRLSRSAHYRDPGVLLATRFCTGRSSGFRPRPLCSARLERSLA